MSDTDIPESWRRVVTMAEPPPATPTLTWADMVRMWDSIKPKRDRFIFSDSLYARVFNAASPELRAELESLRANGTLITSSYLPRVDTVWVVPEEEKP